MNGQAALGLLLICSGIGLTFITFLAATFVTSPLSIAGGTFPIFLIMIAFGAFLIFTSGDLP